MISDIVNVEVVGVLPNVAATDRNNSECYKITSVTQEQSTTINVSFVDSRNQ